MQESEIDITSSEEEGFFRKIKNWSYENWQTILVVLIVLIVGMSAYNYNQQGKNQSNEKSGAAVTDENKSDSNNENKKENTASVSPEASAESNDQKKAELEDDAEKNNNKITNDSDIKEDKGVALSDSDDNGKKYTVTAVKGNGITHLARRALGKYLEETGEGSDLTPEHKIYIEDYMQNRTANQKIRVGTELSFSENLINEAISSAKTLSEKSLKNLQKYTIAK